MVGNISNFHRLDILRILLRLDERKSRSELVENLEIGEGTIRNILDSLKERKLISSDRNGHVLTEKGMKLVKTIKGFIDPIPKLELKSIYPEYVKVGFIIRDYNSSKSFVELRDIALKNGAEGALIFAYEKGKLILPGHRARFPGLEKNLKLNEADLVVVGFAGTRRWAEIGGLAICSELVKPLREFVLSI